MKIPKMRALAEVGALKEVQVRATDEGWIIQVVYPKNRADQTDVLERQRGGARLFATLDAAAQCLVDLGIRVFQVSTEDCGGKP